MSIKFKQWRRRHDIASLNLKIKTKVKIKTLSLLDLIKYPDMDKMLQYVKEHYSQNQFMITLAEEIVKEKKENK